MIINMRHSGIVVRNLNNSIRFYEGLGFRVWIRSKEHSPFIEKLVGIKGIELETAKLKSPCGQLLELLHYITDKFDNNIINQRPNKLGHSHISLTVNSISKSVKYFSKNGGFIINKPQMSHDGKVKVLYCYDNDGNLIEIVEELNI